jgi:asparagine synthase (glutamine-hydrolysing)
MGDDFARDLNGSFNLLILDRTADRLILVTDRIASRRLFHGMHARTHWVGSDVTALPTDRFAVDAIGVGWYLANGVTHTGRTIYEGIRTLDPASVHEVSERTIASGRYWDFNLSASEDVDERGLAEELIYLLRLAMRRRIGDGEQIHLSLSGGFDSVAMVALLVEAGAPDVRCFSYVFGEPEPGSDPFVARQVATEMGYSHRLYQSYHGDMVEHIRSNARHGRGTAHPADEVAAWEALAEDAGPNPVLMVGDHFLGDNAYRTARHRRNAPGKMREFHRVKWLAHRLPRGMYATFRDGIRADVEAAGRSMDSVARSGYFFVNQRLPNTIVPWRQQFPGRFMTVRWPLFDYDLLDWSCRTPSSLRRQSFYQNTAEAAFPRAYQFPRAVTEGYTPPLRLHVREQARQLRALAREGDSRLDEVLPPDVGSSLVDLVLAEDTTVGRFRARWSKRITKAQVATRKKLKMKPIGPLVPRQRVVRNYLILREALKPAGGTPDV